LAADATILAAEGRQPPARILQGRFSVWQQATLAVAEESTNTADVPVPRRAAGQAARASSRVGHRRLIFSIACRRAMPPYDVLQLRLGKISPG
jgi:hypothetical protein